MLPFGVTIPATVLQGSEIPEGLMNNPVFVLYRVGIITVLCCGFVNALLKCKLYIKFLGGNFKARLSRHLTGSSLRTSAASTA
jgi:hypothetical protein